MNHPNVTGAAPLGMQGSLGPGASDRNLTQKRMKRGECPNCGTKTHKVNFFGKKTALTVEGQALYGRCLKCNPLEGYTPRPPDQPVVPQTLEVMHREIDDDAGTMVSGITLDYRLVQGARTWDNGPEENFDDNTYELDEMQKGIPKVRPEPSIGENEIDDGYRPNNRRGPPARRPPPNHDHFGGPGPRARSNTNLNRANSSRGQMYTRQDRPRFDPHMGAIEEKDTLTEASSGENRQSIAESSRSRLGRYQSKSDVYDSSYERGQSYRNDEYDDYDRRPDEYDQYDDSGRQRRPEDYDQYDDPSRQRRPDDYDQYDDPGRQRRPDDRYAGDSPGDSRRRPGQDRRLSSRETGGRQTSSRSLATKSRRRDGPLEKNRNEDGGYNRSSSRGDRFSDPQDRHNDYPSKPSAAQSKSEPGASPQAKHEGRGKSMPKEDDTEASTHSDKDRERDRDRDKEKDRDRRRKSKKNRSKDDDSTAPSKRNGRGMPDDDHHDGPVRRKSHNSRRARVRTEVAGTVSKEKVNEISRQFADDTEERGLSLDDVAAAVACVNSGETTSVVRERVFAALAELVWRTGQTAKDRIVDHKGIEAMVQAMWQDVGNAALQSSAIELMFSLAASSDGSTESDVLTDANANGAVDALLVAMQTHASIEAVQRSGCCTLCCLAAASGDNKDVSDGTLSGAVLSVVNAMGGHQASLAIQEWGVRALYNQCVYSVNSESNVASLGKGTYDGGDSVDVLHQAMQIAKSEVVIMEWVCRVYWCITSSEDVVISLSSSSKYYSALLDAIRSHSRNREAGSLVQGALGALANFAKAEKNHRSLVEAGVVQVTLGAMNDFINEEGVHIEACTLLGNLAVSPPQKEAIIRAPGIKPIAKAMSVFPNNAELQEEALRVLQSLCIENEDAKKAASTDDAIKSIVLAIDSHQNSVHVLENACLLLASLSARKASVKGIIQHGSVQAMTKSMSSNPRELKLQEAACMAFRNLSSLSDDIEYLLDKGTAKALVGAMDLHSKSESVQLNVCCAIWNLCSKSQKEPASVVAAGGIKSIVKVMQSHMESADILEMACGALWSLLDNSTSRKADAVGSGGIDAVTCALVMHPEAPGCHEQACGVLSSVSVEREYAEAIASAQGISIVVETMNNSSNPALLEHGSLVLRNIVLVNADYTTEASSAISTIINAMKDNPDAVGLQREGCNALWAMAAQSEACKSKILALDGVTVIMNTLDRSSDFDVQEAARGAFNQLAMPSFG